MKAVLTKKYYVAESEDHDQTREEEFDSEEAPCPTSDEDDNDEEEVDSMDGEDAGATHILRRRGRLWTHLLHTNFYMHSCFQVSSHFFWSYKSVITRHCNCSQTLKVVDCSRV